MNISIIIPVYNASKYIDRCLNSIFLGNNIVDLEVICVNDGSQDNSLYLLQRYQLKEPRLKVISQINQGASEARNSGLRIAKGRWIMFVDADDYILPNTIDRLLKDADEAGVDIAVSAINRISRAGNNNNPHLSKKSYLYFELYRIILDTDNLTLGSPCSKIFKANIIKDNDIIFRKDLTLFEDAIFVYTYLSHCKKAMTSDIVFYNYDVNDVSTTAKYYGDIFWKCLKEYNQAEENFVNIFKDNPEIAEVRSKHYKSNSYIILWAIYSIYRGTNAPKSKYSALKTHISMSQEFKLRGGIKDSLNYFMAA